MKIVEVSAVVSTARGAVLDVDVLESIFNSRIFVTNKVVPAEVAAAARDLMIPYYVRCPDSDLDQWKRVLVAFWIREYRDSLDLTELAHRLVSLPFSSNLGAGLPACKSIPPADRNSLHQLGLNVIYPYYPCSAVLIMGSWIWSDGLPVVPSMSLPPLRRQDLAVFVSERASLAAFVSRNILSLGRS